MRSVTNATRADDKRLIGRMTTAILKNKRMLVALSYTALTLVDIVHSAVRAMSLSIKASGFGAPELRNPSTCGDTTS